SPHARLRDRSVGASSVVQRGQTGEARSDLHQRRSGRRGGHCASSARHLGAAVGRPATARAFASGDRDDHVDLRGHSRGTCDPAKSLGAFTTIAIKEKSMNKPGRQAHWRQVYKEKGEKQVSWFQEKPALSLE